MLLTAGCSIFALYQSQQANDVATNATEAAEDANRLARDSQRQAESHQKRNEDLQSRIFVLEQLAKAPRLSRLKFRKLEPTRFQATIINDGDRQAALFQVSFFPVAQTSITINGSSANVPLRNESPAIEVAFRDPLDRPLDFDPPTVIAPGEIANFTITVPPGTSGGMFTLHYGDNLSLVLGSFQNPENVETQ